MYFGNYPCNLFDRITGMIFVLVLWKCYVYNVKCNA